MPKNPYGKNESTKKNTSYETDDMFSRMSKLASNNFNISGTTYQTTKKSTTTSNSGSKTASASGSYTTRNTTVQDNKDEEDQKYSLGKGIAGVTRQGIQQVAQGFADTLAFGEDLFWSPYELLTGQQLGSVSDRKPLNRLAGGVREETQTVYDKYASNVEAGGTAAKIFDEYGTATIAAIPQALMALMTAGTSATAQTTAGLTQAATKALNPGTVNTVRNAVTSMAKDPNYWYAFAQVTGPSYESAIADMEQQVANGEKQYDNNTIRTKAALQALGNGLMNAAVEVGGGIQKLPSELQGGQSVWKAIVDTAVDEGKEEVVQGVIERAMQNLVYDKGNAFASLTDEDAVFSAKGAAKEFAGGAIVGGVLGGAQIGSVYGINKGIESYNQNRIGSAYNMDINALIDEGLQSDPSTDSYKMASQLKAKVDNGGTVSNRQAYNLAVANQQAIDMENQQQAQAAAPSTQTAQTVQTAAPSTAPMTSRVQTIQTRLVESGMDSAEAETAASPLSRILSGDITVTNKDKDVLSVGKTAARQVFEEETGIKLPASNSSTRRTVSEYITQTALSQQEVQTQSQQTHDQTSAQTEEITQPSTETAQSGESVLRKSAYENAVEAQKRRSAQVIQADMVSLGENGKRVYQKNVTGAKNISGFSNAFQRYYDAGTIGLKFEDIRTAYDGEAERSVLYEAYAAGVNDAKSQKSATEKKPVRKSSWKKSSGRFYDNRTSRDSSVDEKSMTALKQMAKTFGVDIEVVDTIADDSGRSIANGYYSNGKIVIAADSDNPLLTVAKHEVTHHIQRVSPEMYQAYKDYVMSAFYNNSQNAMNDEIQRQINLANEADIKMTRQEAMDEIVANATEKFLTDRDSIDQLARQNRSLGEAILNAIRDVLKKIQSALQGAKMRGYSDFMNAEQLKKAEQMWVEALADASTKTVEFRTGDGQTVVEDTKGNPIAVVQENGSAVFSLKTYEEGGRDYLETWLDKRVKGKKLSRADADSLIGQMDEYYDICKQFTDKYAPFGAWSKAEVVRDSKGKPVFSVVKANGEYAMNLDFSLVCKKRRTLDAVFSEMINRGILDDADLSEAEISNINSIIRENGFETACALCFVDPKRYRQAKVADSFVDQYNELVKMLLPEDGSVSAHYFDFIGTGNYKNEGAGLHTMPDADLKDGIAKLRQVMKDNGEKTVPYKIAKHLLASKSDRKLLTRSEFMNTKGFEAVKTKNPSVMKLYNSSKGSGGPKAAFSDVQYLGDILKKNAWTPAKAYAVGGVRIQSFSDYIPRLVFDYIQMIGDLSAKQLPAHAYTKEAMFAKQFGMTGIKINLSLVPAIAEDGVAPGLDANGDYYWYDGQSFGSDVNVKGSGNTGFELAKQIQNAPGYSANCGTIAVGVSDEHIRKMLDDPDIRMVIPYHKSSLNHIVSVMNNIDAYKDYTDVQNTRDKKTGSKITGKEFNYNEALRRTGDAKTAAAEYLAWCEENGYLPKFDQFADNENYYKLLEDFSTYDHGEAAPQGAVTMTFPKDGDAFGSMADLINEGLEEDAILEARRQKSIPGIVDQIEAVLKKKDGGKQFSLKDSTGRSLTKEQAEFFKYSKVRDENGRLIPIDGFYLNLDNKPNNLEFTKRQKYAFDLGKHFSEKYGTEQTDYEWNLFFENEPDIAEKAAFFNSEEQRFFNAGVRGDDPEYKLAIRFGDIPKSGKSKNWSTGELERGVSVVDFLNEKTQNGNTVYDVIYGIQGTDKIIVGGWDFGIFGSDGEPLLIAPEFICKSGEINRIKRVTNTNPTSDPDIRFSLKDSNYMKAVESGDMETAQKMVDEAAKEAGYTVKGYHGTTQRFYVFDINKTSGNNDLGKGHYFTTSEDEGKYYTSTENPDVITKIESFADDAAYDAGYDYENDYDDYMETYNAAYDQEEQRIKDEGRVIQAYIRMNNPFVISERNTISLEDSIEIARNIDDRMLSYDMIQYFKINAKDGRVKTVDIANSNMSSYLSEALIKMGKYDGIIDKTVSEKFDSPKGTEHIIAFESNQIKDASPVTYDDSGKVIPLSERFNDENQDIRFSLKDSESDANEVVKSLKSASLRAKYTGNMYASYTEDRINREIKYSTAEGKPDYAKSYIAWVKPSDFIYATTTSQTTIDYLKEEAGKLNLEKLRSESQPIYLMVDMKTGEIVGHEGRHRMLALMDSGVEKVAVIIKAKNDDRYNTKPIKYMDLNGQRFGENQNGTGFLLSNILPISERYSDTVRKCFSMVSDVQFQFKENEKLLRENEQLREVVDELRSQFKTTTVTKTDKRSLDSFTRTLLKDYSSDADTAEVRSALDDLFTYMANGENGDPPVWNDVFRKAYDVAVYVLQNATEVNDDLATEYSDLRHVLRTRGISINKDYDHDLIGYESINDFRKANMGRIKITNDGLPVDVAYQELAESYPGFFDEKEHTTQPDQLNHIEEVLDRLAPVEYNPYERTMRETATWLANEIIDNFFDLPQQKPTYADVMEGKVAKAKYEGKKKLDAERQKNRETVKKLISEHKEAQKQAVAAEREKQKAIQERKLSDLKAKHKEQMKAVRDERDAKLKAQHQKDMESKEKQLAKLRQSMEDRLDKEKQKQKEKDQKRKDKAERDKVVTKIQTDVEWLSERLLNPTDSKHIPEDFKRKVASFLENIDFTTTKSEKQYDKTGKVSQKQIRMAELLNAYKEIANDESSELILSPIEDEMYNALLELSDKGKRFDELEYDELVLIHDIIRYIKKGVASANRAFNKEIKETITGLGENVISENVSKKKNNAPTSGVASASYRLLHYDMVQPQDKFHEIGGTMEMLYKEIRKGFDKHILNIKSACEYMQNLVKGHEDDIKDWSGKTAKAATFTLEDGSTIDLTVGQVMSLYELMKRPQAVGHILEDGQGIIPSNVLVEANKKLFWKIKVKGTKRIDATQASHVTINDIMNICSSLTEDQMKIADGIQRFFNTVCSDWGNETSMTLYDYKKFVEENYFPIKSSDIYLNTRFDDSGDVLLKNMSFTKSLTKKANNPIVVEDIFDVMTNHVNQMSMYNALVVPLTDFSRVFNYRNKESNQSVKGSIIHSDGTLGYQYIVDFIKDINREARPLKEEEVVNKLISKYKKSAVAGSIRVLVQQPTSIVRATEMISPEYIVKGLFQKANYDEMFKWSPIAYWKSLGFFETNMGRSMKGILLGDDGNMVDKLTLDIYGKADDFAWAHLWNAVKLETMDKHPGIDPASDRFMKIVSGRFEEIVDRTQVVDTVFHRSQIMRSTTAFNKMATAFMAERTKSYNLLRSDIWVDAVKSKDKFKVARALVVYVATETVNAMVQGLYDAFNDPEDEDKDGEKRSYLDKYLDNTWENIKTNINPLNMIVYLKEIQSIFDGFTVERMDMAAVSDVISTAKKFAQGKYRYGYLVKELAEDFSGLTGIPIKNVNRQITLIVRSAGNLIGGTYYAEYWVDKLKYNIQDSKNRSVFYKHYTDALLAGYDAQADMMLADMVSNGIPYENIIAKGYAAEKKVAFKDASNLLNEGKESEAKDVIKALAKKYDKKYTTLWKAVKEGASATVPEETYDFNDYKKALKNGQDTEMIEEYLTEYGNYSKKDLEEAAKMLTDKYK